MHIVTTGEWMMNGDGLKIRGGGSALKKCAKEGYS